MSRPSIDARLAELAAASHGFVTTRGATVAGIAQKSLRLRARDGRLATVLPGVYAVGGAPVDRQRLAAAALLFCGSDAALSHDSAAERRGYWARGTGAIHVLSLRHHPVVPGVPVVFHRTSSLPADHVGTCDGLRITTVARTICDLGSTMTSHQVAAVLYEASFRRDLDVDRVAALLMERSGINGVAVARRGLKLHQAGSAGTRSRTEDHLLEHLLRAFREPLVNVRGAAGIAGYEPDLAWPDMRLVVEVDGSGHDAPGVAEDDAARDAALHATGWRVLRFSAWQVWHRHERVVRDIVRQARLTR